MYYDTFEYKPLIMLIMSIYVARGTLPANYDRTETKIYAVAQPAQLFLSASVW